MKTTPASDPGDDDEGRSAPGSAPWRNVRRRIANHVDALPVPYDGGVAPTWLTVTQSGWRQTGGAAPTSVMPGVSISEYIDMLQRSGPGRPSGPDSGVDFIFSDEASVFTGQVKASAVLAQRAGRVNGVTQTDKSAARHRPVSHHSWSAKLEPITVTMRLLYQRGWIRLPSLSPSWLTGAAVFLAGKKRSAVRDEWRSHLTAGLTAGSADTNRYAPPVRSC
jgi:hypothetical protein